MSLLSRSVRCFDRSTTPHPAPALYAVPARAVARAGGVVRLRRCVGDVRRHRRPPPSPRPPRTATEAVRIPRQLLRLYSHQQACNSEAAPAAGVHGQAPRGGALDSPRSGKRGIRPSPPTAIAHRDGHVRAPFSDPTFISLRRVALDDVPENGALAGRPGIEPTLAAALEQAAGAYRAHYFPEPEREARAWHAALEPQLHQLARTSPASCPRLYGVPWPSKPFSVQLTLTPAASARTRWWTRRSSPSRPTSSRTARRPRWNPSSTRPRMP